MNREAFFKTLLVSKAPRALIVVVACMVVNSPQVLAQSYNDTTKSYGALIVRPLLWSPILEPPNIVTSFEPLPYVKLVTQSVDCAVDHCLALTFDDGPNGSTTSRILDVLDSRHARATFFVVGNRVGEHPELLRRMQAGGYEVGNHSWSHQDFTRLMPNQIREQITLTQNAVIAAGLPAPRYFRPPYEARNHHIFQVVGMPFILWNVDPEDWRAKTPDNLARAVIAQAKPGAIIVLHDTKEVTVQALPKILDQLKGQYRFVTISQLLNLPLGVNGEFFAR